MPLCTGTWESTHPEAGTAGCSCHPQASAVTSVGLVVGLVVVVVVQVVVLEACMVHVRHMTRKMGMVKVSQVAPAPE